MTTLYEFETRTHATTTKKDTIYPQDKIEERKRKI